MSIRGNETGSQKLSGPQREDLSSGFPTMQGSNQPTQLQRLVQYNAEILRVASLSTILSWERTIKALIGLCL